MTTKYLTENRRLGTLITKALDNVTQQRMSDMIINNVISTIMKNWPKGLSKDIYIQQDNVKPHIHAHDSQFMTATTQNGFNIQLINQPTQSYNLNELDLGFCRAIQALQYQSFPKTQDDLITKVQDCYDFFGPKVLNYTWLQLQYVMVEILKCKWRNSYKNTYHGKKRLERQDFHKISQLINH